MHKFNLQLRERAGVIAFILCILVPGLAGADTVEQLAPNEQLVILTVENMT